MASPSEVEKHKLHGPDREAVSGSIPGTADRLIHSAMLVEGEAVDLYHFTSVIMRSVDEVGRPPHRRDDVGGWSTRTARSASLRTMWSGALLILLGVFVARPASS